jgi:hypothetical protein
LIAGRLQPRAFEALTISILNGYIRQCEVQTMTACSAEDIYRETV